MLSPLSRGYGTWTGNYDPYTDEGADSDSLPEIEEPHRHGITVGFVSRTSSATTISPQYRINSSHARARNNAGSAHRTRETTLSGRRSGLRRDQGELTSSIQASREGTDTQMTLPKTYLTKKGALVLFAAPEEETDTPTLQSGSKTRFRVCKTPVDAVDTSLKLGTMDKLVMSVLDFGEEELGNNISLKEEKEKLFLNFLNKIDQKDIDERSQPGGDVGLYLKDLKYTTSLQMGLTGDTGLPRSREALELRAILRGLQSDKWPCTYKEGLDFKQPSPLAYQYSRPPSHLNHPPRNQHQRILSSKKLEDSVQSLKSYLGRSLDSLEEVPVPLLTRRRVKRDTASAKKLYDREGTDDDLRKLWSHRPHTNTPGDIKVVSADDDLVEDDSKSTSRQSRDTGYHSTYQGDNCSFILGPRDWTPVEIQRKTEEMIYTGTPTVDLKYMVDKGSTEIDEGEGSIDDGLDGEGIVVGFAHGSDDSDVDIIYSASSHFEVPDNTLEMVEGFNSNDISDQIYSIKSVSPDNYDKQHQNFQQEVDKCAIVSQLLESDKDSILNASDNRPSSPCINFCNNNVLATSCDDVFDEPENIASDGESVNDIEDFESQLKLQSNQIEEAVNTNSPIISRQQTPRSVSSQKRSQSRTSSSMHSTAHDDDQSSVTIIPHDQDLISVDVKSALSQPITAHDLDISQQTDNKTIVNYINTHEVKDTESVVTGDDVTSLSMGEDTTSVIQQLTDIHGEDEESRDKLGEISDPRLPKDDRGRIEMIEIPHPTTPRSTEIATEEKLSPHAKSDSSSKLGETVNEDVGTDTLMSIAESGRKKIELPSIPDFLKPKQQTKSQQKKDQKKKGQINKGKKTISQKQQSDEKEDEITQIIKKKVTLPPENEHSVIPDFVGEALKRSQERSRQQLEEEFREKNELIGQELTKDTLFEGQEGMTAEELELAKKALKEKEEFTKEKLKEKQQKRVDDKVRKSGGSSSVKSKKSKAVPKDHLQQEKERLRQLKELEKQHRIMEIKAIEEKIAAASDTMSEEERKFRNKLQEVQMELDRIQRERVEAEQTEQDVRNVMREDRLKRMEEKARQKKEELARKRQQMLEKKQMEKQLKEEAEQRERQKIMMLMDEEERKKRQEEAKQRQEEEQREEQRRQKEEDDELARLEQEDEERRRQLEEEIEQEQMRRLLEEQDALRIQQEAIAAQKEALLEENRRKKELQALEEQRHKDELDRLQKEEMRKIAEEKARMQELQKLEEEVREKMREEMEKKKDQAIKRREVNLESKSNLNKMRHSQGITRAWVFSYFVDWPLETYFRPIGEAERKKREAKLREKRMKASVS